MNTYDSMLVLTEEPFIGYMPADVSTLLTEPIPDALLARLFACVDNQVTSLFCDLDEGDKWTEYSFWEWREILTELMERIYAILESEGKTGQQKSLADTLEEVESNAMEDTDPFPYDLPDDEIMLEVKRSLGLEEYPNK